MDRQAFSLVDTSMTRAAQAAVGIFTSVAATGVGISLILVIIRVLGVFTGLAGYCFSRYTEG
ncbi:MAG: hypothetical protein FGF48_08665 [Candidatus Brockarchaeota archaeon]|nr:hypothetical protein [Candidatus Brockarchaeota archaeon]